MRSAIITGLRYAGIVFAIGFALGMLRTLYVAPRTGDVVAVALELPLMLAASWAACRRLAGRVSPQLAPRLAMAGAAFGTLMAIEVTIAVGLFGRMPMDWLADFTTPAGRLGLAGQLGFGLMPLVVDRWRRD